MRTFLKAADSCRTALWGYWISAGVALVSAGLLLSQNAGSRNLALAFGTLVGAIVLVGIQFHFELQGSSSYEDLSTEVTIDRAKPEIRQWKYPPFGGWRMSRDLAASSWLAQTNASAFQSNRDKLTIDFVIFSLVSFFTNEEFDWQLTRTADRGKITGASFTAESVSKDNECTALTSDVVQGALTQTGNLFTGAPLALITGRLRLPPQSELSIAENTVVIDNPVCRISIRIEFTGTMTFRKPYSQETPQLGNEQEQYETRLIRLRCETAFHKLRSQHRDKAKYRDWTLRVINNAREWFEKEDEAPDVAEQIMQKIEEKWPTSTQ